MLSERDNSVESAFWKEETLWRKDVGLTACHFGLDDPWREHGDLAGLLDGPHFTHPEFG
jgi:hypothetical protein